MAGKLRCAIYTRKSSDEGLEQDFNSLHAQREACEAYVLSQAGEGWIALPTIYDDGGFSGGSMERPALKRLLGDIDAGKIDIVVVYKVDRITRSLGDFARIVEVFDRRDVSFVSVTQAFNTTSSMGRLTLNVLLSFAQFEREVTSERIRDKIAASKAKGMWMGGTPPLGYDGDERKLAVNAQEAALVREIFARYLALKSVQDLTRELEDRRVRTKSWMTKAGKPMGGAIFNRSGVVHILQNRVYIGDIVHKGVAHPGLHAPILDRETFEKVQNLLANQAVERRAVSVRAKPGPLAGKLIDVDGHPMSPSFSYGRGGKVYRYYVPLAGRTEPARGEGAYRRIGADALEAFLVERLRRYTARAAVDVDDLSVLVRRVELRNDDAHIVLDVEVTFAGDHPDLALAALRRRLVEDEHAVQDEGAIRIMLGHRLQFRGGRAFIHGGDRCAPRRANPAIVSALKRGHADLVDLKASPFTPAEDVNTARAPQTHHDRQTARLALMAPDLQRELLSGHHPDELALRQLLKCPMPLAWADQRGLFEELARTGAYKSET